MDFANAIKAIERFLNDILGTIIPGGVFIVGAQWLLKTGWGLDWSLPIESTTELLAWVAIAYLTGHSIDQLKGILWKPQTALESDRAFEFFKSWISDSPTSIKLGIDFSNEDRASLRSIAMSMSTEARDLSRRFKFLQLMCDGVAFAIAALAVACTVTYAIRLLRDRAAPIELIVAVVLAAAVSALLRMRGKRWEKAADSVCFDVVVGEELVRHSKMTNEANGGGGQEPQPSRISNSF